MVLDPGQDWGCAGTSHSSGKSLAQAWPGVISTVREGILHFILVHASFVLEVTTVFILGSEGLYPPQGDSSREQRPPCSDMRTLEVRMSLERRQMC